MAQADDAGVPGLVSDQASCSKICERIVGCVVEASGKELTAADTQAAEKDCVTQCSGAEHATIEDVLACFRHDGCNEFADCVEAIELPSR